MAAEGTFAWDDDGGPVGCGEGLAGRVGVGVGSGVGSGWVCVGSGVGVGVGGGVGVGVGVDVGEGGAGVVRGGVVVPLGGLDAAPVVGDGTPPGGGVGDQGPGIPVGPVVERTCTVKTG